MDQLVEAIENSDYIETGESLSAAKAGVYSKGMVEDGFAALPNEFVEFCEHFNGLWAEGVQIYAIDPEDGLLEDLLTKNDDWDQATSQQQLVLGESDLDYLVYDGDEKIYFVLDKDYGKVGRKFEELPQAIAYLFGL